MTYEQNEKEDKTGFPSDLLSMPTNHVFFLCYCDCIFFFSSALLALSLWVEKVKGLWYFLSSDERNRTFQGHAIKVVRTARCCSFVKRRLQCMVCTELSNMLKDASYTISDIDLAHLLLNLPILLTLLFSSPFVDM